MLSGYFARGIFPGWRNMGAIILCALIASCGFYYSTTSLSDYLKQSRDSIKRQDWETAYRKLVIVLDSSDTAAHKEATDLLEKYPQIGQAVYESFSKERLEEEFRKEGKFALETEEIRLNVYKRTIATPEEYARASRNFQDVFGPLKTAIDQKKQSRDNVDGAYERQIKEALIGASPEIRGTTSRLLSSLTIGSTTLKQAIALLGRPDGHFESFTILTWPLRIEGDNYTVLPRLIRSQEGVTHSLVLVFDRAGVLSDRSLVRIVK
jgi:hypothetical protein